MKIRTVKPEFWQSEKLATRLSIGARLLFLGLLNLADDHGRFRAHPHFVRGELFPYEPNIDVAPWLQELAKLGVIRLYQVDGSSYGVVVNFAEHQKIDQRWKSKLPAPPGEPNPPKTPVDPPEHDAAPPASEACPTEQVASLATSSARLAESSANLAETTPTDRKGIGSTSPPTPPSKQRRAAARGVGDPQEQKPEPERARTVAPPSSRDRENATTARRRRDGGDDETPIAALQTALLGTRYRADVGNGNELRRRFAMRHEAEWLHATGLTPQHVRELAELAAACTRDDPGGLLAHWFDGEPPRWREVLDDAAMRGKEAALAARGATAAAGGDAEPADPLPASQIVEQLLREAT